MKNKTCFFLAIVCTVQALGDGPHGREIERRVIEPAMTLERLVEIANARKASLSSVTDLKEFMKGMLTKGTLSKESQVPTREFCDELGERFVLAADNISNEDSLKLHDTEFMGLFITSVGKCFLVEGQETVLRTLGSGLKMYNKDIPAGIRSFYLRLALQPPYGWAGEPNWVHERRARIIREIGPKGGSRYLPVEPTDRQVLDGLVLILRSWGAASAEVRNAALETIQYLERAYLKPVAP